LHPYSASAAQLVTQKMEQQSSAPPQVLNLVKWLRSPKSEVKTRIGVLNGKRIDYFKGKSAVKALLSPAYAKLKGVPPQPKTEEEATAQLLAIIPYAFFLRVERGSPSGSSSSSPKQLQIIQQQTFHPDMHFAWFYEGPQWTTYLGGALMVAVILAGVMFPLWPPIMRLGVYYLSLVFLGLIGLLIALAIVRLIFYVITVVVASPGIWLFPKLFADVGFVESFIPAWDWDLPPKKKSRKRKAEKGAANGSLKEGVSSSDTLPGFSTLPPGRPKFEEIADEGD